MYKEYFSRILDERKRALKSAYIAKVMNSVVEALASSAKFVVVPADRDPFEALGIVGEAPPPPVITETDDGAFNDYSVTLAVYESALADYRTAINFCQALKATNAAGESDILEADAALSFFYSAVASVREALDSARANAEKLYQDELADYKAAAKEYKAARSAYNAAVREHKDRAAMLKHTAAMDEYKHELADFAKELMNYGTKFDDHKAAQARLEGELAAELD